MEEKIKEKDIKLLEQKMKYNALEKKMEKEDKKGK